MERQEIKTDIRQAVIEQLRSDERVVAEHVSVMVNDGQVTLEGVVPSYRAKWAAAEAARRVRGVFSVENHLEVRVPMPTPDDRIAADIRSSLMRDADLDLAFIRPKPGSKELKGVVFQALDLKDRAAASVADDAITLSRMDEVLNRAPTVTRGQITMVTKKPREFLRATGASLGCPTFAVSGKLIGITVNRFVRGKSSHNVIIPAADVLEIAEQAHAVKPAEAEKRSGAD
mgnify:CR=1 FL=1